MKAREQLPLKKIGKDHCVWSDDIPTAKRTMRRVVRHTLKRWLSKLVRGQDE